MKKLFFVNFIGIALALVFVSSFAIAMPTVKERFFFSEQDKQLASDKITNLIKKYHIPGLSVALVDNNGIIWEQGFGLTSQKTTQKVNEDTIFSVESQTKMFTTLGVMRAAQNGMLNLQAPIKTYLPNLNVYSVFEKDPGNKITLIHLLSHTAGFAHDAPVGNNYNSQAPFNQHIASILAGTWLQFPVGSMFSYSNVGIDLAGYILQITSGIPYQEYMEKNVLALLKMKNSTFNVTTYLQSNNHAIGHIEGFKETPINYSMLASGGLYSSVADMANYLLFQLNNGKFENKQILKPSLLTLMLNIPFPEKDQIEGEALGIWKGERLNTSYYSHLGRGFGFADNLEWYPEYSIGIVVLTNKYDTHNIDVQVSHFIIDNIIKKKKEKKLLALEHKMIGKYISSSGNIEITKNTKEKSLVVTGMINSGPMGNEIKTASFPLVYIGRNEFISTVDQNKYRFTEDRATNIPSLTRIQDGFTWFLNKGLKSNTVNTNSLDKYNKYIGTYILQGYGGNTTFNVYLKNGFLYINTLKLKEFQEGVFRAANGEMLIFGEKNATFSNLPLLYQGANF